MGRHKKPDDERVRMNKPFFIEWDGIERGPELPLGLRGIRWSTRTLKWWEVWRCSAHAMVMTDVDWEYMLETALIHNEFWSPRREAVTDSDGAIRRRLVNKSITDLKNLSGELRQRLAYMDRLITIRLHRINEDWNINPLASAEDDDITREAAKHVDYLESLTAEVARQKAAKKGK